MKIFAERLRQMQKEKHMTQVEFADYLDIAPGTLVNYMNDRKNPQIDVVAKIAQKLGVTVGWLCGDKVLLPSEWTYLELSRMIDWLLSLRFSSIRLHVNDAPERTLEIEILDNLLCEYYGKVEYLKRGFRDGDKMMESVIEMMRLSYFKDKPLPLPEHHDEDTPS